MSRAKTLDAALIFDNRTLSKQFKNSSEGFKLLAAWLESLGVTRLHACLEATGTYSEAAALFLDEQGHQVSVVNPLRIKGYAQSNMQRNKTDHNEIIKEFANRLKKRGKTPMQIICAAMRKLLHIAYGVLKHKRAFDSSLAFSA